VPVWLKSWQPYGCGWTLEYLWRSTDWLIRGDVALLSLIIANTAAIVCQRFYRYSQARKRSRAFVRDAASALREGDFRGVTKIAKRNRLSHVATLSHRPVWPPSLPRPGTSQMGKLYTPPTRRSAPSPDFCCRTKTRPWHSHHNRLYRPLHWTGRTAVSRVQAAGSPPRVVLQSADGMRR